MIKSFNSSDFNSMDKNEKKAESRIKRWKIQKIKKAKINKIKSKILANHNPKVRFYDLMSIIWLTFHSFLDEISPLSGWYLILSQFVVIIW